MSQSNLKKNIFYSSILTISGYLFPLITFPYVTRVLGVNNIGICNFVDSIINNMIILSSLGIMTVGIREVAKNKFDKNNLSKVFNSLLTLTLFTTFIGVIILLICISLIPQFKENELMLYIGVTKLIFHAFLIEWFYKGLEDFKYITIRSLVIRIVYVVLILLFVRKTEDYILYFSITCFTVILNATINIIYSRKFIFYTFNNLSFSPYLKPFVTLGIYAILTSIYTTFNTTYLGVVTNTIEVGYYTTTLKIYSIIMALFSAFTGVMLPRMSSLLIDDNYLEFNKMINKSIDALFTFVTPLIVIFEVCASQIINIIAGSGYEGAIIPMRIIMPLMLIIGYEQILVLQILAPLKKDSMILFNSVLGSFVAIVLNVLIVKNWGCIGSAIVWVACEISVLCTSQYFVFKVTNFKIPVIKFVRYVFFTFPILFIVICINDCVNSSLISLLIVSFLTIIYFLVIELFVEKNELIIALKANLQNKLMSW